MILFGSYTYGTPDENSDIDLYVVTKDDFCAAKL
ncbi:MAG TPA: nucleotidyltransferase domain-containing protein [Campylobacterales bacterium]|nr:nucleotidyltransferase domain-containing protein [Campylobacterales bacterium]